MTYNPDFNGAVQHGAGVCQTTVRNKRRCSAAVGYLKPAPARRDLTVLTNCLVSSVELKNGRAAGVKFSRNREPEQAHADREVIVAAGAIGTPKLMMQSGVGPPDELRANDIPIKHALPGVGRNLSDHFGIDIVAELKGPNSLGKYGRFPRMYLAALQYALFSSGPLTSNVTEGGAFWYSDPRRPVPDLQFHFLAGTGAEEGVPGVPSGSGITLNSHTLRPNSRGTVRLRSSNPADMPIVDPCFLAEPEDLKTSSEGIRICCEIFRQPALREFIKRMHLPDRPLATRAELEAYARQHGRTSYHPNSTCRMGTDDMTVVDPELRVHGIDGLRICDSSVFPSLIGSNTNAPTIMVAEKASDLIRGIAD